MAVLPVSHRRLITMTRARLLVTSLGLAIGAAIAVPACVVGGGGGGGVEATAFVYQEPPAPRVETVTMRPGFVCIKGRWNWQNGNWAWVDGHYERERAN